MDSLASLGPKTRVERGLTVVGADSVVIETIPAVNMAKSIVLVSCANGWSQKHSGSGTNATHAGASISGYARLISSTEVEVKGGQAINTSNTTTTVSWEVLTND
jgi:hypothetical protein